jgi:hypothetical protein
MRPTMHPFSIVIRIDEIENHSTRREYHEFMLTFRMQPDKSARNEAFERFLKTGGTPPKGVTLLGRWTQADFSRGYSLLESTDLNALAGFAVAWNDLVHIDIAPILEDAQVFEVLKRHTA